MSGPVGRVKLVGAGPGAPDLITVRGQRALREADVILHDELASPLLLSHARADAKLINVGKRGHEAPTRTQEETQQLLVSLAREGNEVVRLKGGDPYVFGRGAEEASACRAAGIPFEVIPGVSSAIGALAYAGLSVTDRRHAASFAVVTGHNDPTAAREATDWEGIARSVDTLVVLMGMRNLRSILARVKAGGRAGVTPAAAVMHATTPRQRSVVATIDTLADAVEAAEVGSPAVVVIGGVVALRDELDWFEALPLFGRRIAVTRQAEQAGSWCRALEAAGAAAVSIPMIQISPITGSSDIGAALDALPSYDLILLTSANAARQLALRAREVGADLGRVRARVVTVGEASTEAALQAGLPVERISTEGPHAAAMLEALRERGGLDGARALLPRAEKGREVLGRGLAALGVQVDEVAVYRTEPSPQAATRLRAALAEGALDAVTFASPSAVRNFTATMEADVERFSAGTCIAAIGPVTAAACENAGMAPNVVAAQPDADALVAALAGYFKTRARHEERT